MVDVQNKSGTRSVSALAIGLGSAIIGGLLSKNESSSQRDWQEEMWERNNIYNTPENQVKRLRQAGVNPALAMQQGALGSGNSSSPVDSYDLPQYSPENIMEGLRIDNESSLTRSQVAKMDQETEAQRIRNVFAMQKERAELMALIEQPGINRWTQRKLQREYDYLGVQIQNYSKSVQSQIDLNQSAMRLNNADADLKELELQFKPQEWTKILSNLDAQRVNILSQANSNNRQAAYYIALEAVEEARKKGLDISNEQAEAVADSYVDKAYYEAEEQYWKSAYQRKEAGSRRYGVGPYTVTEQFADDNANNPNHMRIRHDRQGKYIIDWKTGQKIRIKD